MRNLTKKAQMMILGGIVALIIIATMGTKLVGAMGIIEPWSYNPIQVAIIEPWS